MGEISHRINPVSGHEVRPSSSLTADFRPAPKGAADPLSTLGPVVPKYKPVLENPYSRALHLHKRIERSVGDEAVLFEVDVVRSEKEIEQLDAERTKKLEEAARAAQSRSTWASLSIVAQYVVSAGMIALGVYSAGVSSALLIGAGVVGLAGRAIQDTGFLQTALAQYTKSEELQKKIAHNIEMGMFFLQMGLGLAGGFLTGHGSLLTGTLTGVSQAVQATSEVGRSYHDKQLAHIRSRLKNIETDTSIAHQEQAPQRLERILDQQGEIDAAMKQMIQAQEVQFN